MSVDIHGLSGAYVVGAVDDVERARFERHLAECADCREEVASLREAGTLLAVTSAEPAPDSLRASVLAGIAGVRPLPPVVASAPRASRRRRIGVLVAAAAAFVAIGGVGVTVWHPWSDDDRPGISAAQRVEDAADAQTFTRRLDAGGKITVTRSKSLNQAVVSTEGLAPLDDALTYELWLVHDNRMIRAGTTDGDVSSLLLDGDAATASGAGITVERAGGADTPSDAVVALMDFGRA